MTSLLLVAACENSYEDFESVLIKSTTLEADVVSYIWN
jgi:hypothetical protein